MASESERLTSEEKATLRERAARLKSPDEMDAQLAELREAAAQIVIIGQQILDSRTFHSAENDVRHQ